ERPQPTGGTRVALARLCKVRPAYLVDDLGGHRPHRPRHGLDDQLELWLIDGSEDFAADPTLSEALLRIAMAIRSNASLSVGSAAKSSDPSINQSSSWSSRP